MEILGAVILLVSNALVAIITHTATLRKAKVDQTTQLLDSQNDFIAQVRGEYSQRIGILEGKINRYESHVSGLEDENRKLKSRVHELEVKIKELQKEREALLDKVK